MRGRREEHIMYLGFRFFLFLMELGDSVRDGATRIIRSFRRS